MYRARRGAEKSRYSGSLWLSFLGSTGKKLLTDILGPGGEWPENSLHPGQIIYGQSSGNQWESTPSWRRSKSGLRKSSTLKTHEDFEESFSSTLMTKEFKEIIQECSKENWKHQWLPICPAKFLRTIRIVEVVQPIKSRSKLSRILEGEWIYKTAFGKNRVPESSMKTILQEKETKSLQHYNLVHKFIPKPQANERYQQQKQQWTRNGKNWRRFLAWNLTKVRSKKSEVIDKAWTKNKTVHFASLMDICHLKNAELETKHRNTKGVELYSEATLWKMILDLMQYSLNKDLQHGKWQQLRSWKSYPDCQGAQGQAADAVSANTQVKMKDAHKIIENTKKTKCSDIWIRLPRHKMAKIMVQFGRSSRSSWNEICVRSSFGRTVMGKAIWENPIEARLGEGFKLGMSYSYTLKKACSYLCIRRCHQIELERNKTLIRCGNYSIKKLMWENKHLSLIMYTRDVLKVNVK